MAKSPSAIIETPPAWIQASKRQTEEMIYEIPTCMQQPQLERSHFFSCAGCLCFLIPVLRLPFLQRASCCVLACWGGCTLTVDFLFRSRHIFSEAPVRQKEPIPSEPQPLQVSDECERNEDGLAPTKNVAGSCNLKAYIDESQP